MVTGDEITRAVEIIRATGRLTDAARFSHVVLHEPHKDVARPVEARRSGGPRAARAGRARPRAADGGDRRVGDRRRGREWREVEGMRPALLVHRGHARDVHDDRDTPSTSPRSPGVASPTSTACRSTRGPRVSFGYDAEDDRRIARCISFLRETPEDNGYARPIEGLIVHFDMGRNEVIEVIDHGAVTPARAARALLRRGPRAACAPTLEADLDHPARRTELHRRRQPRAVAEVVVPHRVRSVRRTRCCTRSRTTTTAASGSILHRASVERDGRPLRRPEPDAGMEERVRRGRVGARAHDAAAHARLRLPRRDPLLRRDARERERRAVGRSTTRSACTRRTTGSSGSTSTCSAGAARCAAAVAWS